MSLSMDLRLTEDEQRISEAVTLADRATRIRTAFSLWTRKQRELNPSVYVDYYYEWYEGLIFDDYVVGKVNGTYKKFTFTKSGDEYTFSDPVDVEIDFTTNLTEADLTFGVKPEELHFDVGFERFTEATKEKIGREWEVVLIEAGDSKNGRVYPAKVLKDSVKLFEGVSVFADHATEEEHTKNPGRSVKDKVGKIVNVRFKEWTVNGKKRSGLVGTMKVMQPWLQTTLKEAFEQNEPDFYGLSIDAQGAVEYKYSNGKKIIEITKLSEVSSVDVVNRPAAGGQFTRLVADLGTQSAEITIHEDEGDINEMTLIEQLEALAKEKPDQIRSLFASIGLQEAVKPATEVIVPIQEAVKPAEVVATAPVIDPAFVQRITEMEAEIKRNGVEKRIAKLVGEFTTLSDFSKNRLVESYLDVSTRREFTDDEFRADANSFLTHEASFATSKGTSRMKEGEIKMGRDEADTKVLALRGLITGQTEDGVAPYTNLREAFYRYNPGADPYASVDEILDALAVPYNSTKDSKRIQESVTSSTFGEVFADNMHFAMIKAFSYGDLDAMWRKLASDIVPVSDYRTNHWARVGGYPDLDTVAEGATYQETTTPGDEEITFTISKYGNLEYITEESILADRGNVISNIPMKLGRGASRTAWKFFMNMVTTTNGTMPYDTVALYHASHGNTGTAALSVSSLNAVDVAMRQQVPYGHTGLGEYLGELNAPKYLIIPSNLRALAKRIIDPSDAYGVMMNQQAGHADSNTATYPDTANTLDPHMFKGSGMEPIVYEPLSTDVNNWFVSANPALVPTFVAAFLNGRQQPELFIQNDPKQGSRFSADKIGYKVRFVFGGAVQDHRSFYRQVVA